MEAMARKMNRAAMSGIPTSHPIIPTPPISHGLLGDNAPYLPSRHSCTTHVIPA